MINKRTNSFFMLVCFYKSKPHGAKTMPNVKAMGDPMAFKILPDRIISCIC
jgi:hypothetical protein